MEQNRYKAPDLALKLAVSKQAVYHQLTLEVVAQSFKMKLAAAGIGPFVQKTSGFDLKRFEEIGLPDLRDRLLEEKDKRLAMLEKQVNYENVIKDIGKLVQEHDLTLRKHHKALDVLNKKSLELQAHITVIEKHIGVKV